MKTVRELPEAWRQVLPALLLLIGAVLLAYRETALAMVGIWSRSDTFQHGFAVLPIAMWLIWRRRAALASTLPEPTPALLLPLALAALVWLLGELTAVNAATQFALVALLVLVAVALLGPRTARRIVFPLAFLFFAVPIGEFMIPLLMQWTADFTVGALQHTGVPVYREGQRFIIPSGSWSVVEECSGIRYLMASGMVGSLFAYLTYRSLGRRLAFIAASFALPILANWLRAYLIVLLGHVSGNRLATGADHLIYGWVFFGFVMTLMFGIGARWAEPAAPSEPRKPAEASEVTSATSGGGLRRLWPVFCAAVLLLLLPRLAVWDIERRQDRSPPDLELPAALAGGWVRSVASPGDWKPAFRGAAAELQTGYRQGERAVGVYLAYYRAQDHERKLISSVNVLATSSDPRWAEVSSGRESAALGEQQVTVRTARLRGADTLEETAPLRLVAWHCYWIDGHFTSSDVLGKLYGLAAQLRGRGDDGASIVIFASEDGPPGEAEAALHSFMRVNAPMLDAQLRKVRDGAA